MGMAPGVGSGRGPERGRGGAGDDDMWAARARFWAALEAADGASEPEEDPADDGAEETEEPGGSGALTRPAGRSPAPLR